MSRRASGVRDFVRRVSASRLPIFCSRKATGICRPRNCTRKPRAAGVAVSLATVYNTLHQFTEAGLLRILAVEGARTYFDTNTSDHHHFFVEGENRVMDIEHGPVTVGNLPEPPEGMEIANVDIVIRLRPKRT